MPELQGETAKCKNKIQNNKRLKVQLFCLPLWGIISPNEKTPAQSIVLSTQVLNFGDILPMRV